MQGLGPGGDGFDMWVGVERLGRQLPHALERRIVQAHPAVRAEHGDGFGEVIERLALHFDQRFEAPAHVEAFGNVVVEISDAAFRIGCGDDPQGAAVRQMPHMFFRLDRAIGFVKLLLPLLEVLLLGQLARAAQGIEDRGVGRRLLQHPRIEVEQHAEGGVVEGELAIGVEDGDAGGQLVEHAAVRLRHASEFGAHGLGFGAIDGHAGGAGRCRRVDDIEDAPFPGDDCRKTFGDRLSTRAQTRDLGAGGALQQFEFAFDRVDSIVGFDGAGIGAVGENQPARRIARPDRRRQCLKHRFQGCEVARNPVMPRRDRDQFALDAAHIAQSQDGAAAQRAAFRFQRPAGLCRQGHGEAATVGAQARDRVFHALRRGGFQPGAEGEHARRPRTDDRDIAQNIRLVRCRRPGHQHLRLRQEQLPQPVDLGLHRHRFVA